MSVGLSALLERDLALALPRDRRHTQRAMRQRHLQSVLDVLRTLPTATQTSIMARTGLSRATVSRMLAELRDAEFIELIGNGDVSRGRKPALVRLHPQARLAVGIELDDKHCVAAVTDLRARLLQRVVVTPSYVSPEALIETVVTACTRAVEGIEWTRICALGIGTPGVVDTAAGVIRLAPVLGNSFRDLALAGEVRERLKLPVVIADRSKAAAVGEHLYGAGKNSEHLVYVWIGDGIGAGILLGGKLQLGAGGSTGELGHLVVLDNGPLCVCGGHGCLQALASGPVLVQRARELLRGGQSSAIRELVGGVLDLVDMEAIVTAAASGDPLACRLLDEAGGYLGRGLAAVVNLLNPDMIILGGPLGHSIAPFVTGAIQRELQARALSVPLASVRIVPSSLGHDAGAVGAAALALEYASVDLSHHLIRAGNAKPSPVVHQLREAG